jgi:hypothetical protein
LSISIEKRSEKIQTMAERKRMNYLLKTRGLHLNVELEDLLDSSGLPGKT